MNFSLITSRRFKQRQWQRGLLNLGCLVAMVCCCGNAADGIDGAEIVPDFAANVQPILNQYCVGCHGRVTSEAGLRLDTYAELQKGSTEGSVLESRGGGPVRLLEVLLGSGEIKMPPEDEPQLDETAMTTVKQWVEAGSLGPKYEPAIVSSLIPSLPPSHAPQPINALAIDPMGRYQAYAISREVVIEPWAANKGPSIPAMARRTLQVAAGRVTDLAFMADGTRLLVASGSEGTQGDCGLWDVTDAAPRELIHWSDHADGIYALAVSPDGRHVATGSYDRTIVIRDIDRNEVLHVLTGHNGAVFDLDFSSDGKVLVSASADATVKVWSVDSGQRLDTLSQPLKEQLTVDISPDGEWIAAAGDDNRIRLWQLLSVDAPQINPLWTVRFGHDGSIFRVRFTPDGKYLVSLAADQSIKIWSVPDLLQVYQFEPQPTHVQTMSIAPIGNSLAVGRMDGKLVIYSWPDQLAPLAMNTLEQESRRASPIVGREERSSNAAGKDNHKAFDTEPNDELSQAVRIDLPFEVEGVIDKTKAQVASEEFPVHGRPAQDRDLYRFSAEAGAEWLFEVRAQADNSLLDSYLAVLSPDGDPVPRVRLQATRDSYLTFRGKNSDDTGDFRLHNWEEMRLNQFLYVNGEVVKFYHYPRGPDSGFNVYPNEGLRHGFFETTPLAHAVNEPCYVVEPHSPQEQVVANGLPSFLIPFENDDASDRSAGTDSRLTFVAPKSGNYVILIKDIRGFSGPAHRYRLTGRRLRPHFDARIVDSKLAVTPGTGVRFGIEVDRKDNFEGPVTFHFSGIPEGVILSQPLVVEAGHSRAFGTLFVPASTSPEIKWEQVRIRVGAEAEIDGQNVRQEVGDLGKIELAPTKSTIRVQLAASLPVSGSTEIEIIPGGTTTAVIRIERGEFTGPVGFGKEEAIWNLPHGIYVANTGLNGVLIVEGTIERTVVMTAEPWVSAGERWVFVEADIDGLPTSAPVLLRVAGSSPSG